MPLSESVPGLDWMQSFRQRVSLNLRNQRFALSFQAATIGAVLLVMIGISGVNLVPQVQAAELDSCREVERTNLSLVIECAPGFATQKDRVTLYSRNGFAGTNWREALDYADSTWLFDIGANDAYELVIRFSRRDNALIADIFDQGSEIKPAFLMQRDFPSIKPNALPIVRVVAPDGWWVRDALVNFNLDIVVDGTVAGAYGADRFLHSLKTDGKQDFEIHIRDTDRDGRPDYQWIQSTPTASIQSALSRTEVLINPEDNEPPLGTYWFWPYLDFFRRPSSPNEFWTCVVNKGYNISSPPIMFNTATGTVDCIGEFVASRGNANNWFAYSFYRLGGRQLETANWESPFAFYDLAQANDGWPDLQVRVVNWLPNDLYSSPPIARPVQLVRYSWDQAHRHSWTYKVDLVGNHQIDSVVELPDLRFKSIPPAQLPNWVISNDWSAASFVAVEMPSYWTSEGIYEWDSLPTVWASYLEGKTTTPPQQPYGPANIGFRNEYTIHHQGPPILYFSPVDRKLHLRGAEAGVWNLDNEKQVHYSNLGGAYINHWSVVENGVSTQDLWFVDGQLVLADSLGLRVKQTEVSPALFTTSPPSSNATWSELAARLRQHEAPSLSATDLSQLFDQVPGQTTILNGARLKDLRLLDDGGFRFVLQLPSESGAGQGQDWASSLAPGEYVVRYRETGFTVSPLIPAKLALSTVQTGDQVPVTLTPVLLRAELRNTGTEDAFAVPVTFVVRNPEGSSQTVGTLSIDIPGEGVGVASLVWLPQREGAWTIYAEAAGSNGPVQVIQVMPPPSTSMNDLLRAQGLSGAQFFLIGSVLALIGSLAAVISVAVWHHQSETR